jgi:PAS domain S-box-containing protein
VPLFVEDSANGAQGVRPDGFMVGVFRFQSLLDSILKASPRYRVQVYDRAELVYSQGTPPRFMPPATVDIHAYGADWQVQVFATAELIESGRSLLPTLVLWGGLVGAWILAFIVILGQRSELYSRRARTVNHQLQEEIIRRQQIETSLRESEERLQFAFQASGEGWWDWDITAGQVKRSPQYLKLLEYEVGEFPDVVASWEASIHPDDFPQVMGHLTLHLQDGAVPYICDYRVLTKSGRWHWIADYGMVVARDGNNQPQRMIGMLKDIDDRKAAEAALAESQQRYQNLIENSPDIIERFDLHLRYLYVNPAITQVTGIAAETFLDKTCRNLGMDEAMVNTWEDAAATLLKTGQKQVIEFSVPTLSGLITRRLNQSSVFLEILLHANMQNTPYVKVKQQNKQLFRQFPTCWCGCAQMAAMLSACPTAHLILSVPRIT